MRNPAMLVTSFNRPNIHYTVTLLDVQQAPSSSTAAIAAGMVSRAAAGSATSAADEAVLGLQYDDTDGGEASIGGPGDDIDLAGYSHLLPLLKSSTSSRKPATHNSTAAAAAAAADSGTNQQQQQSAASGSKNAAAAGSKAWPGPVAIVYALKRSTVDVLVRRLAAEGLAVAGYHAALPDAVRAAVLERWREGKLQVIICCCCCCRCCCRCCCKLHVSLHCVEELGCFVPLPVTYLSPAYGLAGVYMHWFGGVYEVNT
jgi:hypothetical protein